MMKTPWETSYDYLHKLQNQRNTRMVTPWEKNNATRKTTIILSDSNNNLHDPKT